MILKGTWVQIESVVLTQEERSMDIPMETKVTPLKMWVKGYSLEDSELGEEVLIETLTGRKIKGKLVNALPAYTHSFGDFVEEIMFIGPQAREILFENYK